MKLFLSIISVSVVLVSTSYGASVTVQNLNSLGDAAYGLFDEGGVLVGGTDNLRIGYFVDAFDADAAWASGDLVALNTNFVAFGDAFGTVQDGAFSGSPTAITTPFVSKQVTLWATDGGAFTDTSAEHLIYNFTSLTFQAEPWTGAAVQLGTDAGTFLNPGVNAAGGFNNFSEDFGFGGGALPGFNTVSLVPEPSTYAALSGVLALTWVMLRRRRG